MTKIDRLEQLLSDAIKRLTLLERKFAIPKRRTTHGASKMTELPLDCNPRKMPGVHDLVGPMKGAMDAAAHTRHSTTAFRLTKRDGRWVLESGRPNEVRGVFCRTLDKGDDRRRLPEVARDVINDYRPGLEE